MGAVVAPLGNHKSEVESLRHQWPPFFYDFLSSSQGDGGDEEKRSGAVWKI